MILLKKSSTNTFLRVFLLCSIFIISLYGISTRFNPIIYLFFSLFYIFSAYILFPNDIKISKSSIFALIIILSYGVLFFISSLIGLPFEVNFNNAIYCFTILLSGAFVIGNLINKYPNFTIKGLGLATISLSIVLFFALKMGIFPANRYQHVGNCLAAAGVYSFFFTKKKYNLLILFLFLFLTLSTGARQGALAFIVGSIFYFYKKIPIYTTLIILFLTILIILIPWDLYAQDIFNFAEQNNLRTVKRVVYKLILSKDTNEESRVAIYTYYLTEGIKWYPQFMDFEITSSALPHNFFIEYLFSIGYLLGAPTLIFIICSVLAGCLENNDNNILFAVCLVYFIPFNLSSGLAASKYFLFYFFLYKNLQGFQFKFRL